MRLHVYALASLVASDFSLAAVQSGDNHEPSATESKLLRGERDRRAKPSVGLNQDKMMPRFLSTNKTSATGSYGNNTNATNTAESMMVEIARKSKSRSKSTSKSKPEPMPPCTSMKKKIEVKCIPRFFSPLIIPPVIHDDNGERTHVEVSMRQIEQQILPEGYPKTTQWAYGIPGKPETYNNPAGTIEVTKDVPIQITWLNELVKDPETCGCDPKNDEACQFLKHVVQDACGNPVIDQTLHWANPKKECKSGEDKTDCTGITADVYDGPVPNVVHVHGAHVGPGSDGYPEAWWLPAASNIPEGLATEGTYYETAERNDYFKDYSMECPEKRSKRSRMKKKSSNGKSQGQATNEYSNDQPTTTLWYHDHTLGITRLNVYAAAAGFYLIRDGADGETGLLEGTLPGPPAKIGQDPNNDFSVRRKIREIPLAIQPKSFYEDGSLYYPANRAFFQEASGNEGTIYADNSGDIKDTDVRLQDYPYLPDDSSDIHPVWNPEAFFETMVVNGRTWPYLQVASERYRFRLLNAADSRFLNLALFVKRADATCEDEPEEIPFYVIGSDQGLLPHVVEVSTGSVNALSGNNDKYVPSSVEALLMGPAERYDVIVDFSGLDDNDEVYMVNTGPDEPFGGFEEEAEDPGRATGQVMKFIVCTGLNYPGGDPSTHPNNLTLDEGAPGGAQRLDEVGEDGKRELRLIEILSQTVPKNITEPVFDGPVQALLGTPDQKKWEDPIATTVTKDMIEEWDIDNWTVDAHPIHLHLVKFQVVERGITSDNPHVDELMATVECNTYHTCNRDEVEETRNRRRRRRFLSAGTSGSNTTSPIENGWKDTVIVYPGEKTRIRAKFDIKGLYVWHCHILSHEDNEMMLPFCVSTSGSCLDDCPVELCPDPDQKPYYEKGYHEEQDDQGEGTRKEDRM